jgi:hypothetical protein
MLLCCMYFSICVVEISRFPWRSKVGSVIEFILFGFVGIQRRKAEVYEPVYLA